MPIVDVLLVPLRVRLATRAPVVERLRGGMGVLRSE